MIEQVLAFINGLDLTKRDILLLLLLLFIANAERLNVASFAVRDVSYYRAQFCETGHDMDWTAMQDAMSMYTWYAWQTHRYSGLNQSELCDQ